MSQMKKSISFPFFCAKIRYLYEISKGISLYLQGFSLISSLRYSRGSGQHSNVCNGGEPMSGQYGYGP